jgi:hypothetical protein
MSDFDPETFMQQTVDAPLETEFTLIPTGEYIATIDDFTSDAFEKIDFEYKKGSRAGQPGTMTKFNCPFVIQDDAVKAELARDKVTMYKQLILDVADDGGLDFGKNKNIDLGRIRAAVGQNDPGPWSIANLRGAGPVMVKVVHVDFERKDKSKGKRAEIERVVRIA